MRVELTHQEVIWLTDLLNKTIVEVTRANEETPHPLLELRRDNLTDLEDKLKSAVKKQNEKIRRDAR